MINITTKKGALEVESPYNKEFINFARMRGGKWSDDKKVWMFDPRDEFAVRSALIDIYGTDNYDNCDKADVRCEFSVADTPDWRAYVAGWEVARCHYGDVKLSDRTVLVKGGLRAHRDKVLSERRTTTIIEVRAIPEKAAQKLYKDHPEKVEIIGGIDEQKLKDEKRQLQERIEEIDELLDMTEEKENQPEIIPDLQD